MEQKKTIAKYPRSKGKCNRKRSIPVLSNYRSNGDKQSDENLHVQRRESREDKLKSNNRDLAKALAKSHIKEREMRQEISKLKEDHMDLVTKLQHLKEKQNSQTYVIVKNKRALMDRLINAVDIMAEMTGIVMESHDKEKKEPGQNITEQENCSIESAPQKWQITSRIKNKKNHGVNQNEDLDIVQLHCINQQLNGTTTACDQSENSIEKNAGKDPRFDVAEERHDELNNDRNIKNISAADEEKMATDEFHGNFESQFIENEERIVISKGTDNDNIFPGIIIESGKQVQSANISINEITNGLTSVKTAVIDSCCDAAMQNKQTQHLNCTGNQANDMENKRNKMSFQCKEQKLCPVRKTKKNITENKERKRLKMQIENRLDEEKENFEQSWNREHTYQYKTRQKKSQVYTSPFHKVKSFLLSPMKTKSPIIMRVSRQKRKISYVEPSLNKKLRRGDPCTDATFYYSPYSRVRKRTKAKGNYEPLKEIGNVIREEQ